MGLNRFTDRAAGTGKQDRAAELIREIIAETTMTENYTGRAELDPRVLEALAAVPREIFVQSVDVDYAYFNQPLSIGHGQTISQPFIVALMTDLLRPKAGDVVLEVGTGSGYQAAVLSHLVRHVYSIEVVPELAASAARKSVV